MPAINRALVSRVSFRKTPICLAVSALMMHGLAQSAPVLNDPAGTRNGGVTVGAATISQNGTVTTVNQTSGKAAINWWSFGTAPNETVNFVQPNSSSITLNRVIGNEKSVLQGALNANGQVFLINSNGVLITKGATVNAAGLIASTLDLSDDDFKKGKTTFKSTGSTASVINEGKITVTEGGYVALLGSIVSNKGTITATKGTVALNSGNKITLNFNGDSLLSVSLDEGTLNALVENKGAIYANGGQVIMTAQAANDLLSAQVNNTGIVQAQTIDDLQGSIEIYAHGGIANIDGTLDASAPTSGDGGFIETSGDRVKIADTAKILTKSKNGKNGKWLIDPVDFTIAASGGDMTGTFLSNYLNTQGDYKVQSANGSTPGSGDINVNDAITWTSNNKLSLIAVRNININAAITGSGVGAYDNNGNLTQAGLTLKATNGDININAPVKLTATNASLWLTYAGDYNIRTKASYSGVANAQGPVYDKNGKPVYGTDGKQVMGPVANQDTSGGIYGSITMSGSDSSLKINGDDYTLIRNVNDFAGLNGTGKYALVQDLNATGTTYNNSLITNLSGTFTGLGHTISNLTVDIPDIQYGGALIGTATNGSIIRDIGLINTNLNIGTNSNPAGPNSYAGAMVGLVDGGKIKNVYANGGSVTADVDGNCGCYATAGLIGQAQSNSSVSFAYSDISGTQAGLIANMYGGTVDHVHASGNVESGYFPAGGLIGSATGTGITNSHATGNVSAGVGMTGISLGGLVGAYTSGSGSPNRIANSFASGEVNGGVAIGGFIGQIGISSNVLGIENSYATGKVTGSAPFNFGDDYVGIGGFIGQIGGSSSKANVNIKNSFATGDVTANTRFVQAVGGFIGFINSDFNRTNRTYGSRITNSFATGSVTAPLSRNVGGFIGDMVGIDLSNSHSTGAVAGGKENVGGFAGSASDSTISQSYSSGLVTGTGTPDANTFIGGLIGKAGSTLLIDKFTYYNATGVKGALGNPAFSIISVDPNQGLTGNALNDIQFYANGTIDQVLADRTLQAANVQQERLSNAGLQAGNATQTARRTPRVEPANPVTSPATSIDKQIVFADTTNFSADVKSIMVDGVMFDLGKSSSEKDEKNK